MGAGVAPGLSAVKPSNGGTGNVCGDAGTAGVPVACGLLEAWIRRGTANYAAKRRSARVF